MELSTQLIITDFANGGPDKKLICGHCKSPEPLGAIIGGQTIHYERKRGGQCWSDASGYRVICNKCGTSNFLLWTDF